MRIGTTISAAALLLALYPAAAARAQYAESTTAAAPAPATAAAPAPATDAAQPAAYDYEGEETYDDYYAEEEQSAFKPHLDFHGSYYRTRGVFIDYPYAIKNKDLFCCIRAIHGCTFLWPLYLEGYSDIGDPFTPISGSLCLISSCIILRSRRRSHPG